MYIEYLAQNLKQMKNCYYYYTHLEGNIPHPAFSIIFSLLYQKMSKLHLQLCYTTHIFADKVCFGAIKIPEHIPRELLHQ